LNKNNAPTLLWFRRDLRLADNPALTEALLQPGPVIPVFIWSPDEEEPAPGGAAMWWLHQSLKSLQASLPARGSKLILRSGPAATELADLAQETGAGKVFWNRQYEPALIKRDTHIKAALTQNGIEAKSFKAGLLYEPWQIRTQENKPYQVYTRYWIKTQSLPPPSLPLPAPSTVPAPSTWPQSLLLSELSLEPQPDWAAGLRKTWTPGEQGARKELNRFVADTLVDYATSRNIPSIKGTSRLSPHLHAGEISPRQIWKAVGHRRGTETFLKEIVWREFAHHLLYEFPHTPTQPLRIQFAKFPWNKNPAHLKAWQQGQTGYPIVDAGMRELWATGWMHNRVRMVTASFLVKHLRISWQDGAAWFWDTLVDANLANNTLGWQWSAGCGADAAPYFRIFNPILQGEKFDPQGAYVKTWVPALKNLPPKWIHKPWQAPTDVLSKAGISLGKNYPPPIVDHIKARAHALNAFKNLGR
jgi:deoxyribodipyrimidine photo-lyase